MRFDIKNWCNTCATCQLCKYSNKKPYGILWHHEPTGNLQTIFFDLAGPFPPCKGSGFTYVLTIYDLFSKYTVYLPLLNCKSKTIIGILERTLIPFWSYCRNVVVDAGSYFESKLFKS